MGNFHTDSIITHPVVHIVINIIYSFSSFVLNRHLKGKHITMTLFSLKNPWADKPINKFSVLNMYIWFTEHDKIPLGSELVSIFGQNVCSVNFSWILIHITT